MVISHLLDIRCPDEFVRAHIRNSMSDPRGILESAVDYGYEETVPEPVEAVDSRVVVICRSGNRSILAAHRLGQTGFGNAASLRTRLRGWNDNERPLFDSGETRLDPDPVDRLHLSRVSAEQPGPARRTRPHGESYQVPRASTG